MEIKLVRKEFFPECTRGVLTINGVFECYTLEDKVREVEGEPVESWKVKGETAIPRGRYRVLNTMSTRFGRVMPLLMDVPGFSGIRIHKGNKDKDTEGCLILGNKLGMLDGVHAVLGSGVAIDSFTKKFVAALEAGEEVWIEVE